MSVESRVAAVTRRSRRQRIKIDNLDATRICPIAFPPISTDYQLFTRHGFASPGNHRRDHQQPPNLQPPLLFPRRETVAENESTTYLQSHSVPQRSHSELLVHGHAQRTRRNRILRPSCQIPPHHQMDRSYAFHPCSRELHVVDAVVDARHRDT